MVTDSTRWHCLDVLKSKKTDISTFNFDTMTAPPLYSMMSYEDINNLHKIVTSLRYSGNPLLKYEAIDSIMKQRNFIRLSSGTNRLVYKFIPYDGIVVKVATDEGACLDSKKEFINQQFFKPFVTKCFETDPSGVVSVFERVNPITSREEFEANVDQILAEITGVFIGKYVMADIGAQFFLNWGVRNGFGPVLLDYPYAYELDGNKLYCQAPDPNNPSTKCGGVIDYDDGYSFLYCSKCGCRYRVSELAKAIDINKIMVVNNPNYEKINRRKHTMKVGFIKEGVHISTSHDDGFKPNAAAIPVIKAKTEPVVKSGKTEIKRDSIPEPKVMDKPVPEMVQKLNRGTVKIHNSWGDKKSTDAVVETNKMEEHQQGRTFGAGQIADMKFNFSSYNPETKILVLSSKETVIHIRMNTIPQESIDAMIQTLQPYSMLDELEATKKDLNEKEEALEAEKQANAELSEQLTAVQDELDSILAAASNSVTGEDQTTIPEETEEKAEDTETTVEESEDDSDEDYRFSGIELVTGELTTTMSLNPVMLDDSQTDTDFNVIVLKIDDDYMRNTENQLVATNTINGMDLDDVVIIPKTEFAKLTGGKSIEEYNQDKITEVEPDTDEPTDAPVGSVQQ